jgi:4-hydroxythreonine-4-phosphate dehydrogenase
VPLSKIRNSEKPELIRRGAGRSKSKIFTIGITIGEPAGIGPEVIRKALRDPRLPRGFRYRIIGDASGITPGKPTRLSARRALAALEESVRLWKAGEIGAIVTGPVQKENLADIGFAFPGQTEFFAARCGKRREPVMVLTDPKLTVALVSTHCSLRDAVRRLSAAKIVHTARETDLFLRRTGIRRPRLALAGVNPHAGENGLFGNEETRILKPALAKARRAGVGLEGPFSPDTVFHRAAEGEFDAVICMYHDQGLIPFKLLAFVTGVNVTLGLPLVRTSPDHGTALDLAGKNKADATSMVEAIRLACRLVGAKAAKGNQ